MSEETEGMAEAEVEETTEPAAVAVEEAPAQATGDVPPEPDTDAAAAEPEADAAAVEPETDADVSEPDADTLAAEREQVAEAPELEAVVVAEPVMQAAPGRREAQLYLCERGHRTLILWGDPPVNCNARKTRNEVCGLTLYHSTELPEQIQKALNPIKASKKKSGKK
jgi:hypothetical protein